MPGFSSMLQGLATLGKKKKSKGATASEAPGFGGASDFFGQLGQVQQGAQNPFMLEQVPLPADQMAPKMPGGTSGFGGQPPMIPQWQKNPDFFGALDQAGAALGQDVKALEQAQKMQYGKIEGAQQAIGGAIAGGAEAIKQQAGAQKAEAYKQAGQLDLFANEELAGYGDEAKKKILEGEESFKKAIANYEDTSKLEMSRIADVLGRNSQTAMREASAGRRPDGSLMTPEEQQATMQQIKFDFDSQKTQAMVPLVSQFNDTKAQMQIGLANFQMGAGAQIGQLGSAVAGQQFAYRQMAHSLRQTAVQAESAMLLQAEQYALNGQLALADFIKQTPPGVVTLFGGLAQLIGLASQPGAKKMKAL